jgi:hypothetical protein
MDRPFIQFFWCFRAESVRCSRVWGLSMSIHRSDSHVASPRAKERRIAALFISTPVCRPMPTPEHAMAPHTSEPDASARSLCLSFRLVSFASPPFPLSLCAIVVNRPSLFQMEHSRTSWLVLQVHIVPHSQPDSARVAHCPSSVGLVLGSHRQLGLGWMCISLTSRRPTNDRPVIHHLVLQPITTNGLATSA